MLSTAGRICAVSSAVVVTLTVPRVPDTLTALAADDLPTALAALLELALCALASWVLLGTGLAALQGSAGRIGRAALPAALFVGLAAVPAQADDGAWPLDGLQLPQRPLVAETVPAPSATTPPTAPEEVPAADPQRRAEAASPEPTATPGSPGTPGRHGDEPRAQHDAAPPRAAVPGHVVVVAGDTLWSLARAQVGPGAPASDVADRVRTLHQLNRAVIGPDPDLIVPGQRLHVPHEENR